MNARVCKDCKKVLPLECFSIRNHKTGNRRTDCRKCRSIYSSKQRAKPENYRKHKNQQLFNAYGITFDEYESMLDAQDGVCAICREKCTTGRMLAVDHNHITGEVRGLLCRGCNQGIGLLKGDGGSKLLFAAIKYLQTDIYEY